MIDALSLTLSVVLLVALIITSCADARWHAIAAATALLTLF